MKSRNLKHTTLASTLCCCLSALGDGIAAEIPLSRFDIDAVADGNEDCNREWLIRSRFSVNDELEVRLALDLLAARRKR